MPIQLCDEVIKREAPPYLQDNELVRVCYILHRPDIITSRRTSASAIVIEGSYQSKSPPTTVLLHFSITQMSVDGRWLADVCVCACGVCVCVMIMIIYKKAGTVTRSRSTNINRHNFQIINIFISLRPGHRHFNINRLDFVRFNNNQKKERRKKQTEE